MKGHADTETNQQFEVGRKAVSQKRAKGRTKDGRNKDCYLRQKLVSFRFFGDFIFGEKRILA